ncbi:L,D-transpeptidase [Dictyobacter arantiisoli]|uniref:L,D-TPase catalytic domain-containing protein n=1 Tax=Dictyobacter arantiisoli TaxID=2014874 RepID=A0A5A5TGH2_9CHLR|nr:L,D-transpeptidase [Dictyobacter arantiisoli]GCF10034.1 hypothetical protein KDI_35980 [Dictyobacter arantiisoli]
MHDLRGVFTTAKRPDGMLCLLCSLTLCLLLSACQLPGQTSAPTSSSQQPQASSTSAAPAISDSLKSQGSMELQTFQQWITQIKTYEGQTDSYQQQYLSDQHALQTARTVSSYQSALAQTRAHVTAIQLPAAKVEESRLQQQLQQQVSDWENKHPHHDSYNNITYKMGFEYDNQTGIGTWINDDLSAAKTLADYQQIIENTNMYLTNFKAYVANSSDTTPSNQVHQTDLQLLTTYHKMDREVLVVSLAEQTMRVYNQGKLTKTFQVTTGQPDKPTPPGSWWVESRQTHIVFKSSDPKGSRYWYPDTPINYGMQYHSNGYYVHDSWWRAEYGPNTQFPHQDVTGDTAADLGSHGCVNMSTNDAKWIYDHVQLFTGIIIY